MKVKVFAIFFVIFLCLYLSVTYSMKLDEDMFKEGEKFKQNIIASYDEKSKSFNHKKEVVVDKWRYEIILNGDKIIFNYNALAEKGKFGTSKYMQAKKNGNLVEWYCGGTFRLTRPC